MQRLTDLYLMAAFAMPSRADGSFSQQLVEYAISFLLFVNELLLAQNAFQEYLSTDGEARTQVMEESEIL